MNAVEIEEAVSELASKPFDRADFAYQFLAAFGNKDTTINPVPQGVWVRFQPPAPSQTTATANIADKRALQQRLVLLPYVHLVIGQRPAATRTIPLKSLLVIEVIADLQYLLGWLVLFRIQRKRK